MAFLKSSPMWRNLAARHQQLLVTRTGFLQQHRFYAQSSYGGGEGDPKGESPQQQGPNPSAHLEHPGPPPPDVGRGSGGGPTKAGDGGNNPQQKGTSDGGESSGPTQSKSGASPKIHSEGTPAEASEDVKKHNEELENRHDRAANKVDEDGKDNVHKGYWSGTLLCIL